MPTAPSFLRRHAFALTFVALLLVACGVYERYNQRYVGAVDWYGYYQEGLLFKAGRTTLPVELPADRFPAIVPLGFNALPDGRVVPQYPPGYPLLLAAASCAGLEFNLMPLVGLASCLLLFAAVRDLTGDRWVGLLWMLLWAFCPIVVYGSTMIMSDLVAATAVLLSYWLYRRGHVLWSAWAAVFAVAVRPTNVLYLAVFAVVLVRDRRLVRYGLGLLLPAAAYALYNQAVFGAPWRTGYSSFGYDLTAEVFAGHLAFYLGQTLLQVSPVLVLLIAWAFRAPRREAVFFAAWFGVFLLFYCFWRSGEDSWWWTRFLLPGYVPLFLLSAGGFARVRAMVAEKLSASPRRGPALAVLSGVVALVPFYFVVFGDYQHDLWSTRKGYVYYQAVKDTEQAVPAGSYVGSIELTGAFRIYSSLGSFVSVHPNAPALIAHVLAEGRAAYVLVEPWNKNHPALVPLLARCSAEKVRVFGAWGGLTLYRLHAPAPP